LIESKKALEGGVDPTQLQFFYQHHDKKAKRV
jgi:hypothetical protein